MQEQNTNKLGRLTLFLMWSAVAGGALGFAGFLLQGAFWLKPTLVDQLHAVLDALYAALQLYALESNPVTVKDGAYPAVSPWLVHAGRLLAPAGLYGVVLSALAQFLSPALTRTLATRRKGHVVVCHDGSDMAFHFAEDALESGRQVVALSSQANRTLGELRRRFGSRLIEIDTDETLTNAWGTTGVARAKDVIVCTGSDSLNLSVAQSLLDRMATAAASSKQTEPVAVHVHVADELLSRQAGLQDGAIAGSGFLADVRLFNIDQLVARRFFEAHDLLREVRLGNGAQAHLAFLGLSDLSLALMIEFLRISPCARLGMPVITVVTDVPAQTRGRILSLFPEIEKVARLRTLAADFDTATIGERVVAAIETDEPASEGADRILPLSAAFVTTEDMGANVRLGLSFRQSGHRLNRCRAPLFVYQSDPKAAYGLVVPMESENRLDKVFETIGAYEDNCTLAQIAGARDLQARKFHEAYLAQKAAGETEDGPKGEAERPWLELKETYRQANRRAADHARTKLVSIGCRVEPGLMTVPEGKPVAPTESEREILARLEHESWKVDRQLEGWRHGPARDEVRLFHPDIVPWADLDSGQKAFDFAQVETLFSQIVEVSSEPTVRREVKVGLIGHNQLDQDEARRFRARLADVVWPNLARDHKDDFLTFITPLAPGSDLIAAETLLGHFAKHHLNWELRIVQTLPVPDLVASYMEQWSLTKVWSAQGQTDPQLSREDVRKRIIDRLLEIRDHPRCRRIVNLEPMGSGPDHWASPDNLQNAYRDGSSYMAEVSDVLVAFLDRSRPGGEGGTGETVERYAGLTSKPAILIN